ncbi:MAG TPA: hypothetical protein VF843_08780 [Streptosporangiaceae bacterium]
MTDETPESAADGGQDGPGDVGDIAGERAANLLDEVSRLRRQTRTRRHAYWLPLLLFGLLTFLSVPFYVQPTPSRIAAGHTVTSPVPYLPGFGGLARSGWQGYLAVYWLVAIAAGFAVTYLWYRRRGRRVGLWTPARGFLITGAVISLLVLILPLTGLVPGDLVIRGTFPFMIIAAGLAVLAWAERSRALTAIAVLYAGIALVASLYNIENVLFRLGWNPSASQWRLTGLPNVLLPALILLLAGGGAYFAQRTRRRPA